MGDEPLSIGKQKRVYDKQNNPARNTTITLNQILRTNIKENDQRQTRLWIYYVLSQFDFMEPPSRAIYSSADIAGPEDIFLGPDGTGVEAAAGILLRELSNDGSGAVVVLVLGVANLEEGGDGLLPTFSKEPLDPKD
ncbi:hypothetical protein pdam_00015229 [Pocillopora damicornis]|uniref:Uncharacterized protein n=1 Tax=Pocillopora damicornis TaxID=46731 RepID=A0A3M6TB31_POCDA|nr:hypothetical protein pdam_00015229 [Pocillopora damicornis]